MKLQELPSTDLCDMTNNGINPLLCLLHGDEQAAVACEMVNGREGGNATAPCVLVKEREGGIALRVHEDDVQPSSLHCS